jgi:hypothetical protein
MSDKNLAQRINIKFCVKIGNSASETLALVTLTYGEYAMKKSNVLNGIGGSRNGEKPKRKEEMQIWTEYGA